ncbi:uncharacterized protein DUF4157 [Sphingomonas sp. PP-CE-3G-477]|uniref:eCIS core domain-containing protein n=1 Tax=Sphingomonas sp. PP-CE-3G-477 TaxID=2135660 RepID=UPI000D36EF27|nr:DUF4157 domain-containing protein [Sphingomonas sp. PP-CE-3G-477]PTQ58806.1 uncharacterized protein DUF4157 [Sphingomonas sp. PP-CE-3G-477]
MFSPSRIKTLQRILSAAERAIFERALEVGGRAVLKAADILRADVRRRAEDTMTMLGKLLHEEANAIADKDRGPHARPLTAAERKAIVEAYGSDPDPSRVRIVPGPGESIVAFAAFVKGNPAITIGNTIYLRWGQKKINYPDFTRSDEGLDMLVHEYSHVIQYHRLGFSRFGARYAAELTRARGDADSLYDYKHRKTTFNTETLEGQAEMVGNYAKVKSGSGALSRAEAAGLRKRLKGSGVYGL